ncbi:hypothetical protein NADFUDRAFT_43536 [Nadsonia fulvescens var. elongata DSM 6958]|uniref:Uncharacterized protein n=1 Tax=Nadsonia fulvescens var. elongata DSM 6958 TaxID=857566 RepID=A0A1E3PET6_9ASCO|nr:hypothetical protein NADFUDRAFT_43536 [Nadsonia fulvescens var. elongata DSM 6958]
MPPKPKTSSIPITIRLKNGKSTILLPILPSCSLSELQNTILEVAQETGLLMGREVGLGGPDHAHARANDNLLANDDSLNFDDLDIPIPSFETTTTDDKTENPSARLSAYLIEDENQTNSYKDDDDDLVITVDEAVLSANDIQLALPRDQRDFSKGWDAITSDDSMKNNKTTIGSLNILTGYIIGMKNKQLNSDTWDFDIPEDFDDEQ